MKQTDYALLVELEQAKAEIERLRERMKDIDRVLTQERAGLITSTVALIDIRHYVTTAAPQQQEPKR